MSHFYCMPAFIMEDESINPMQKLLYMLIFGYTHMNKPCFYSNATLGKKLGLHERNVQKSLSVLKQRGLIVTRTVSNQRYIDTISFPMMENKQLDESKATAITPPPHGDSATPPTAIAPPIIDKLINKDNINTPLPKKQETAAIKQVNDLFVKELIEVFKQEMPKSPKPRAVTKELLKEVKYTHAHWHEVVDGPAFDGKEFTAEQFRVLLREAKANYPDYCNEAYEHTKDSGKWFMNGIMQFVKWKIVVGMFEGKYH